MTLAGNNTVTVCVSEAKAGAPSIRLFTGLPFDADEALRLADELRAAADAVRGIGGSHPVVAALMKSGGYWGSIRVAAEALGFASPSHAAVVLAEAVDAGVIVKCRGRSATATGFRLPMLPEAAS